MGFKFSSLWAMFVNNCMPSPLTGGLQVLAFVGLKFLPLWASSSCLCGPSFSAVFGFCLAFTPCLVVSIVPSGCPQAFTDVWCFNIARRPSPISGGWDKLSNWLYVHLATVLRSIDSGRLRWGDAYSRALQCRDVSFQIL